MFLKSRFFQIISVFTLILGLTVFAFADTIRLKDGSIIKGKIISFDNNQFVIVIGDGTRQRQLRFFADEIASIKFDNEGVISNTGMTSNTGIPSNTGMTSNTPNTIRKEPSYSKTRDGNNTVITVGSAPRENQPVGNSTDNTNYSNTNPADNTDYSSTNPANITTPATEKPIQIRVKVLADNTANGWTNAGWVIRKGQRIRIVGNGRISLGNGRYSSPSGISTLPDSQKLVKDQPTGGLIAVVGDDNNDFLYIGDNYEFVADRDGALFLGINEGILEDNSGSYEVMIEVYPN